LKYVSLILCRNFLRRIVAKRKTRKKKGGKGEERTTDRWKGPSMRGNGRNGHPSNGDSVFFEEEEKKRRKRRRKKKGRRNEGEG